MGRWPEEIKQKAREMRLTGASFGEITKTLQVAKSTLHSWVRDIKRPAHLRYTNQKEWLQMIRPLASAALKRKREKEIEVIIKRAREEVRGWDFFDSRQVQKAFLSLLYWTEGQKLPERGSPVKFANTDPRLVLLFITLLKNCYDIDIDKIKIRLHIHWYHSKKEAKEFWKKLLGVKDSQFYKLYVKKRSQTKRFRRNFMGICFVVYYNVDLRQELVHTAYAIQERIIKLDTSLLVPVA